jgi:hypothetical protein
MHRTPGSSALARSDHGFEITEVRVQLAEDNVKKSEKKVKEYKQEYEK